MDQFSAPKIFASSSIAGFSVLVLTFASDPAGFVPGALSLLFCVLLYDTLTETQTQTQTQTQTHTQTEM